MELTHTIWLVSTVIVVWTVLVEELIVGSRDTLRGKVITHSLHPHGDCGLLLLVLCASCSCLSLVMFLSTTNHLGETSFIHVRIPIYAYKRSYIFRPHY